MTLVWGATTRWVGGLALLALSYGIAAGVPAGSSSAWWLIESLTHFLGVLLPFATFAGGVAALVGLGRGPTILRSVLGASLGVAVLTYAVVSTLDPIVESAVTQRRTALPEGVQSSPATTPAELLRRRRVVTENPPVSYSFDADQPLDRPPNWLTYSLYQPLALALFAILNTLLGFVTAGLTTGLSPPARRHTRWIVGLVGGVAFFVAVSAGAAWVRSAPGVSGVAGAWLPLLIPLAELAVLAALLRWRGGDLHASSPRRV